MQQHCLPLDYSGYAGQEYLKKWNMIILQWKLDLPFTKEDIEVNILELRFWLRIMNEERERMQPKTQCLSERSYVDTYMSILLTSSSI